MDASLLLQAFQHLYRDGLSMAAALRREDIPHATYYDFRRGHPEQDTALRAEAQLSVAAEIELERTRAVRMREVQRLKIEEMLLEGVGPVLRELIADAKAADGLHTRVAALRELRQWLEGRLLHTAPPSAAEEPARIAAPHLPDFLSSGQAISELSVKSVGGDEIILKRGEVIEGGITES